MTSGRGLRHFHAVILAAKEDCENTQDGCTLIDLEIENRPVLGDPTKIREKIGPERSLERCPPKCLHVILDRSDPD